MVKFSGLPDPLEPRRLRERVLPFVLLYGFALVLRVAAAWILAGPGSVPSGDALPLDQAAWNLANGHGLALGGVLDRAPTAAVPPLLPWLLHFVYRAFGHDYFTALLAQAALAALLPLLVARLGAPIFGGVIGFLAGIVVAADPLLLSFSGALVPEMLLAVTMTWAMIVSVEWVRGPTGRRAFWAGIAWGVAALAHPAALALPLATLAWAWLPLGLLLDARTARRQIIYVLVGLAVIVAPWMLRNVFVLGVVAPVTGGAPPLEDAGLAGVAGLLLIWWVIAMPPALWAAVHVLRGARRLFQGYPLLIGGILTATALLAWGSFVAPPALEPLIVLFAAAGAEEAWRKWNARGSRRA